MHTIFEFQTMHFLIQSLDPWGYDHFAASKLPIRDVPVFSHKKHSHFHWIWMINIEWHLVLSKIAFFGCFCVFRVQKQKRWFANDIQNTRCTEIIEKICVILFFPWVSCVRLQIKCFAKRLIFIRCLIFVGTLYNFNQFRINVI